MSPLFLVPENRERRKEGKEVRREREMGYIYTWKCGQCVSESERGKRSVFYFVLQKSRHLVLTETTT